MPGLWRECEVEERVEEGGRVHRPLHHRLVALAAQAGDELILKDRHFLKNFFLKIRAND